MALDQGLRAIQEYVPSDMPAFNHLYNGWWDLGLVLALCGLSVLLTLIWLLAVWRHIRRTNTVSHQPMIKEKLS